jgi:hypothetical protein
MQKQNYSMEPSETGSQPQSIRSKCSKELFIGPQAAADQYLASRVQRIASRPMETTKTGGLKHPPSSCSSCFENDSEPFPITLQPSSLMLDPYTSLTIPKVSFFMAHPPRSHPVPRGHVAVGFAVGERVVSQEAIAAVGVAAHVAALGVAVEPTPDREGPGSAASADPCTSRKTTRKQTSPVQYSLYGIQRYSASHGSPLECRTSLSRMSLSNK